MEALRQFGRKICPKRKQTPLMDDLETLEERAIRLRSLKVIYFTMFLMSLGFSIVITGVWPYLRTLNPEADMLYMGLIVAANPFAQMVFSPLMGMWTNKTGVIRLPLLITIAIFTISSGIYSSLELVPGDKITWMMATRFLVGLSSANITAARSYLSAATRLCERTNAISYISLAQILGFVLGPAFQAAATKLGDKGYHIYGVPFNQYTVPGWTNVFLGIINFVLFLPGIFEERKIAAREAMRVQGMASEREAWKAIKPDYLASWTLICAFFILVFNFVLLETLGTPLTMHQFGWSKTDSLFYMGIIISTGAIAACVVFLVIGPLCKKYDERKIMLWGGFFMMILGRVLLIPWGPESPLIVPKNASDDGGCPDNQEWCEYTPKMTLNQFIISYGLTTVGYPVGITLVQTIFSKIIGPRPQGTWMGLMTGAGCFSRVLGPLVVTEVYSRWGTYYTFGLTGATLVIAMLWLCIVNDRLIPQLTEEKTNKLLSLETEDEKNEALAPLNKADDNHESPKDIEMQIVNGKNTQHDKD